jgi:copper(I)-binding protein
VLGIVAAGCGGGASADEPPALRVVDAYVAQADGDVASAYLTLADDGGPDTLVGVRADVGTAVELHRSEQRGGLDTMVTVDELDVPGGGQLELVPFGDHLMLTGLDAPLEPGGTVSLELSFRRSPPITVQGPVLSYDDVLARSGGS